MTTFKKNGEVIFTVTFKGFHIFTELAKKGINNKMGYAREQSQSYALYAL